jgi:hypothetical protein
MSRKNLGQGDDRAMLQKRMKEREQEFDHPLSGRILSRRISRFCSVVNRIGTAERYVDAKMQEIVV